MFILRFSKNPNYHVACENVPHTFCDLTDRDLDYKAIYEIRVRATVAGNHSDWVKLEFCPDKNGKRRRTVNRGLSQLTIEMFVYKTKWIHQGPIA